MNLTEEQRDYQQALRDWLGDVASSDTLRSWLEGGDRLAFEARFSADDWAGVGLPEILGGQGGGLVELAVTAEELGRAAAPSAAWLATVLAAHALPAELVREALAGAPAALLVSAGAIPGTGEPQTLHADGTISGTVLQVLAGDTARWFVVPVGDRGHRTLRLVEAGEGVRVERRHLLDQTRSAADVVMERAPSLPLDADAEAVLDRAAAHGAVLVASDTLGACQRMLDLSVAYSKQRRQFGRPIGSFQAVKHAAAMMLVGVEAARSICRFAAASVEAGEPLGLLHAAAAKAQVTAEGARCADSALTVHGAIGYTWEYDLQLFYKRAKLNERLLGGSDAWNRLIADGLVLA